MFESKSSITIIVPITTENWYQKLPLKLDLAHSWRKKVFWFIGPLRPVIGQSQVTGKHTPDSCTFSLTNNQFKETAYNTRKKLCYSSFIDETIVFTSVLIFFTQDP